MTETRTFHIGDILTVTGPRMLSPRGIDGVTDLLEWMTGERPTRVLLKQFADGCEDSLLAQHPDLAVLVPGIPANLRDTKQHRVWLAGIAAEYGETREVAPLTVGERLSAKLHAEQINIIMTGGKDHGEPQ